MTKAELNQEISNKIRVSSAEITAITEALYGVIKDEIAKGNKVSYIQRLWHFQNKKKSSKKSTTNKTETNCRFG